MARRFGSIEPLTRARYLRGAGHVSTGLWLAGWVAFAILVGIRAANDLVSAVAVLICVFFATSFGLNVAARRVAWREIRRTMQRDDLVASRSRGRTRVRERRPTP